MKKQTMMICMIVLLIFSVEFIGFWEWLNQDTTAHDNYLCKTYFGENSRKTHTLCPQVLKKELKPTINKCGEYSGLSCNMIGGVEKCLK